MRMIANIGDGGHLIHPCYNCMFARKMRKNPTYLVKESENQLEFYDYDICQSLSPRTIKSSSTPKTIPEALNPIIENSDFENHFIPGSLHTLLGNIFL